MRGLLIQLISVQSNVMMLIPRPERIPKSWFTGILFGAAQHTKENNDSAWNRKPAQSEEDISTYQSRSEYGLELTWKEEEKEGPGSDHHKIAIARDPTSTFIILGMQGIQQCARDEVLGPHHTRGPDEKTPAEASQAESC